MQALLEASPWHLPIVQSKSALDAGWDSDFDLCHPGVGDCQVTCCCVINWAIFINPTFWILRLHFIKDNSVSQSLSNQNTQNCYNPLQLAHPPNRPRALSPDSDSCCPSQAWDKLVTPKHTSETSKGKLCPGYIEGCLARPRKPQGHTRDNSDRHFHC